MALVLGVGLVGRLEVARGRGELLARVGGRLAAQQRPPAGAGWRGRRSGAAASSTRRSGETPSHSCAAGLDLHARLDALLVAVDRAEAPVGEQLSPGRVHVDHELGDEHVDGRAAAARLDRDAAVRRRGWCSRGDRCAPRPRRAPRLQRAREAPEREAARRRGRPRRARGDAIPRSGACRARRCAGCRRSSIALQARLARADLERGRHRRRGRARRRARGGPAASVARSTAASGSIVILPPGKYTVDRRSRAIASSAMVARRRRAPAPRCARRRAACPSASRSTENASSISVVSWSSMEKARRVRLGQALRAPRAPASAGNPCRAGRTRRRSGAGSSPPGPASAPARASSFGGASPAVRRRLVERAPFEAHLVGLEEQRVELRGDRLGHAAGHELARPRRRPAPAARRFFSSAGERGLEVLLRRRLVAALAALVEVHRVRVQRERHRGRPPAARARGRSTRARARRSRTPPAPHTSHRNCGSIGSASFCASGMKAASGWPSKRSRIASAFTFERLPWAASTWKDAPASARIVPTRNAPSSSKRTCFIDSPPTRRGRARARGTTPSAWSPPRTTVWKAPA